MLSVSSTSGSDHSGLTHAVLVVVIVTRLLVLRGSLLLRLLLAWFVALWTRVHVHVARSVVVVVVVVVVAVLVLLNTERLGVDLALLFPVHRLLLGLLVGLARDAVEERHVLVVEVRLFVVTTSGRRSLLL